MKCHEIVTLKRLHANFMLCVFARFKYCFDGGTQHNDTQIEGRQNPLLVGAPTKRTQAYSRDRVTVTGEAGGVSQVSPAS